MAREATGRAASHLPVIFLVGLNQLILTSDFSLASVTLPAIGKALALKPEALSWIVSASALTFAGFLILGGRAGDVLGRRTCIVGGLGLFAVGSLICATAPVFPVLIAGRALQGLGGAALSPANFSLINTLPEARHRHQALGVFGLMQGVSLVLGLLVGGWLATTFGWRSVFLLNLPVVAVAVVLAARVAPRLPAENAVRRIDLAGAALIMASTTLVLLGVSRMGAHGWTSPGALGLVAGALVGFAAFFWVETKVPSPLAPPSLYRCRNFLAVAAIGLLHLAGVGGQFVILNLYMQRALGFTPFQSGLGMMPYAAAVMFAGQVSPAILGRFPMRAIVLVFLAVYAVGVGMMSLAQPAQGYLGWLVPGMMISTLGSLPSFLAMMNEAAAEVPPAQQGVASAVLFTTHQIGVPLGAAIALAVVSTRVAAPYQAAFLATAALVVMAFALALALLRRPRLPPHPVTEDELILAAGPGAPTQPAGL